MLPEELQELIESYNERKDMIELSPTYHEAQVRLDFLDTIIKILGWDLTNKQNLPDFYREVIVEARVKGKEDKKYKKPDYAIQFGKKPVFFIEAKKLGDLECDSDAAKQIRQYGWSANMSACLLTSFKEFAVYDTTIEPLKEPQPTAFARVLYCKYDELDKPYKKNPEITNWDFIYALFSKENVQKGSLENFRKAKKKNGTQTVDEAFLQEIEQWREELSKDIYCNNKDIYYHNVDILNDIVQKTIDRIIFLRICEDRGIEPKDSIEETLKHEDIYKGLLKLFSEADQKFNSGLFHFRKEKDIAEPPDTISHNTKVSREPLRKIIKSLYYPTPYQFSVMPADILGSIYERFLGRKIILTSMDECVIQYKPEVLKAGGVYYTPNYIVDYIVENTVGEQLKHRNLKTIDNYRIIDPACGSGSFLIICYQYLINWYLQQYKQDPTKYKNYIWKMQDGSYSLRITERKKILTRHIFGTDIDKQAVEVTKLSLLLKALEGVKAEEIQLGLRSMLHERALPNLANNIKCGNSLISTNLYVHYALDETNNNLMKINPFDWKAEFKEVFDDGGFDTVIGNPPWVSLTGRFGNDIYTDIEKSYLRLTYPEANTYMPNVYEYFLYKDFELLKDNGYFGNIVPDRLASNIQFTKLRKMLLSTSSLKHLVFRTPFPGVTADTLIIIYKKCKDINNRVTVSEYNNEIYEIQQNTFDKNPNFVFSFQSKLSKKLNDKVNIRPLSYYYLSTSGFGGKSKCVTNTQISKKQIAVFKGESISRYIITHQFYFEFIPKNITGRTTDKKKLGVKTKILIRKTGNQIIAAIDESGTFPEQSLYFLYKPSSKLSPYYFLALLNSKLITYYYQQNLITNKNSIAQIKKEDLDRLPIPYLNLAQKEDKGLHDSIVNLSKQMCTLISEQALSTGDHSKIKFERQISPIDNEINQQIYKLYNLTVEEINIIENIRSNRTITNFT